MATTTAFGQAPVFESKSKSKTGPSRARIHLLQLLCFVVVLLVWTLVNVTGLISPLALPSVPATFNALISSFATQEYWQAIGQTLFGAVIGLIIAAVIGIPLGLITGTYIIAEKSSRLLVDILRAFPVIALLPVFLLVIGSNPQMKITVVFIACVFPIFLQAQYGAQGVTPMISETVRSYRIPRLLRFVKVVLPASTPSIMTGLRLAATTSVLVAIGVEILTTLPGIGHEVVQDQQAGNSPYAYANIFTAGAIGYGITRLSEFIEGRLLRWRPPAHTL